MAKDKEKPAAEEDAPPKKGKSKLLIIIIAAVVVLAGGGGGAWYFLHAKKASQEDHKEEKHEADKKPPVFVKLEPFTVNLAAEGEDHMLQTDIELKVADAKATDNVKAHMPEIRNTLLLHLSSKTASGLSSSEGKQKLSSEIKEQINKALHAKEDDGVSGVYFTSFVIQ